MADNQNKPKGKSAKMPTGVVFDVRRPGKTPAPPTSRPVIVGHKPAAQAAQASVSGISEASPLSTRRKIQITPSGDLNVVESNQEGDEKAQAEQAPDQNTEAHHEVPEKDKEALAVAALDAVTGAPDFSESEKTSDSEKSEESDAEKEGQEQNQEQEDRPMFLTRSKVIMPLSEQQNADAAPESKDTSISEESEETSDKEEVRETAETNEQSSESGTETEQQSAGDTEEQTESPETSEAEEAAVPPEEVQDAASEGTGQEKEQKTEPHIDPLFDEHGNLLAHPTHHHRSHGLKIFALVLVIILLAAAILDILLDLEILNLEGIPHTDFFLPGS